jgi:hypothetical protein
MEVGSLRLQAFAAASVIRTTNNNYFGDTKDGFDSGFSEIGVNAMWHPHERVRLSGQALHRRAGKTDEEGLRLDYAQIDVSVYQDANSRVGVKFGLPKLPYGLYNETRDVPFTRPGILLPQSIYFDNLRGFVLAAPGAYLHGSILGEYGSLEFNLGVVRPNFDSESFENNFLKPFGVVGSLRGENSTVASLRWDTPTDTTLALYRVELDSRYRPGVNDILTVPGRLQLKGWLASIQQRIDTLTLTAELAMPEVTRSEFNNAFIDGTVEGRSWYAQAEWRFLPAWEAMLRVDRQLSDVEDQKTEFRRARDLTLGLRWDVSPSVMLRAEWHHVDGTAWLPPADNPGPPDANEPEWNMFLFQFAYRY